LAVVAAVVLAAAFALSAAVNVPLLVDAGTAEEPDEVVVHDRVLLTLGLSWAILFAAAVYL